MNGQILQHLLDDDICTTTQLGVTTRTQSSKTHFYSVHFVSNSFEHFGKSDSQSGEVLLHFILKFEQDAFFIFKKVLQHDSSSKTHTGSTVDTTGSLDCAAQRSM